MKKYKELMKNIGLLTLSNFGSKLLMFFLVPLYTAVLTTEEYGKFDFLYVTISLLVPLLTLNISEGAMRFLLDKDKSQEKKKYICKISNKYVLISIIIVIFACSINYCFNFFEVFKEYCIYFILFYIVTVYYQLLQNFIRGYDKISSIAISGIINSVLMLTLNIVFLLVIKMGLKGYFIANILANGLTSIYLMIILKKINNKVKLCTNKDDYLEKEMIEYSKPMMLNSVGWWINNVSDRYIVTLICGAAANGIYSVAYKIPSILSIIQSIFNQAWTIFAVKAIDNKENSSTTKDVYIIYNIVMVFSCSILIIFTKILAKIFYLNEFYDAWQYMPFLMISTVFGALSGLIGGLFSAIKNSKIMGTSTLTGAILNIILNIVLVFKIGTIGAAISTAISYFVVWIIRIIEINKNIKLNLLYYKDIIVYFLLTIQAIIMLIISNDILLYILEIIILLIELLIYYNEIISFSKTILKKVENKLKKNEECR